MIASCHISLYSMVKVDLVIIFSPLLSIYAYSQLSLWCSFFPRVPSLSYFLTLRYQVFIYDVNVCFLLRYAISCCINRIYTHFPVIGDEHTSSYSEGPAPGRRKKKRNTLSGKPCSIFFGIYRSKGTGYPLDREDDKPQGFLFTLRIR